MRVEDDDASYISHSGVVVISQGYAKLRYLALYVYDITNVALVMVGQVVCTSQIIILCLEKRSNFL